MQTAWHGGGIIILNRAWRGGISGSIARKKASSLSGWRHENHLARQHRHQQLAKSAWRRISAAASRQQPHGISSSVAAASKGISVSRHRQRNRALAASLHQNVA